MNKILVEGLSAMTTSSHDICQDILILQFTIVNAFLVSNPDSKKGEFVLVDTGLNNSVDFILESIEKRFGKDRHPQAIILTHGHFDHIGSVIKFSELWDVPVYAHQLEMPYLTGKKDYPQGDPTVDGGMVSELSPSFPHKGIDISSHVKALPNDNSVPGMPGWKWIHTPGHTEGHISLFREKDRVLIAGDAFSTTKQESLMSVITQEEQISGPPKYLTTDWEAAENSIKHLKDLKPSLVLPSHGKAIEGKEVMQHLEMLIEDFNDIAKPKKGRFVDK